MRRMEALQKLVSGSQIIAPDFANAPLRIENGVILVRDIRSNRDERATADWFSGADGYGIYKQDKEITIKQSEIDQLKQKIAELEQRAK